MPIYIEKGFKTARPNELLIKTSPFEWLQEYEPKAIEKNKNEDDASFLVRLQTKVKEKLDYFISGRIDPCNEKKNKWHRVSGDIIFRDLIVIDYDDIDTDTATFIEQVKSALPNTALLFYPSLRYTVEKPRMRVVIEPSRPLVGYEYEIIGLEIVDKIGLPYDPSFTTWTQVQGLPVITPLNEGQKLQVVEGQKYPIPNNIEPPIKDNIAPVIKGLNDNRTFIPYENAVKIFDEYVRQDANNLLERDNCLSAIMVLAKAVQCNEIDYNTALKCSEMLAMGDVEWIEGNRKILNRELQNDNIRTAYTFKRKFYDIFHPEPIKTMEKAYKELEKRGDLWRSEHEEINERTGEVKQPPVPHRVQAEIIMDVFTIVMMGDASSKDKSQLYYYNYDTRLYENSEIEFNKFSLKVEYRGTKGTWLNTMEILKINAPLVEGLEDKYLIPVKNGIYNRQTKQLDPFDPQYIITSTIDTAYNPNAVKPTDFDVDAWLSSIACGDEEMVTLLWQIMNELINPNHTRGKIIFLYGPSGNNGKGTFQALMMNIIGKNRVSTLKPPEFQERFKIAQLIGKVCNIGDDISDAYIDDISNLMSIATGDAITVEEKGKPAFTLISKACCMFSGNSLPKSRNKEGWGRRILIVPFNADFSGQVNDPRIKDEYMNRQDVKEYVLKKVLEMDFDKFIIPKAVQREIDDYQIENDNVRAYIEDVYIENGYHLLERIPIDFITEDYLDWLESKKLKRLKPYGFGKAFVERLKKMTSINYKLEKVRVSIDQLNSLPEKARKHKSTGVRNAIVKLDV